MKHGLPCVRSRGGDRSATPRSCAVLKLYRTKTVAEIMEITGKKERTIRRWIADARIIEEQGH